MMTPLNWLAGILFCLLLGLQYRLWIGDGSVAHLARLRAETVAQEEDNQNLRERRRLLAAEVNALRNTTDAIEERARHDLGMIKKGETFFMIVKPPADSVNQ